MLRAILFDFNGVLVDDESIHFELFQQVLAEEGIELSSEDYFAKYLGYDDRACFRAALEATGGPAEPVLLSRLIARKAAYYQNRVRNEGYPLFPGAVALIDSAISEGLMLGIVSGALRNEVEGALRLIGVRQHFKTLVTAEDVGASKPDPEGYRRGLQLLSSEPPLPSRLFHPHEVLAIEDSPTGLEAAQGAGLMTLGVAHTYPASQLDMADHTVASVLGLTLARIRVLFHG